MRGRIAIFLCSGLNRHSLEHAARTTLAATLSLALALLAIRLSSSIPAFAAGVFGLGMICALLHLDRAAYRFGGITLAIVLLGSRPNSAWIVAAHRFSEVSLGIATGLVIIALWRERQSPNEASPAGPGPRP